MSTGAAWSWGNNNHGELGDNLITSASSPVSVITSNIFSVISASDSSLAIDSSGIVWTWGNNSYGELGDNTTDNRSSPVSIIRSASYTAVASGSLFAAFIDGSDGSVWTVGVNEYGTLGNNESDPDDAVNRSSPVSIARAGSYSRIAAGSNSAYAIDGSNGSIWAWGYNDSSQLGNNDTVDQSSPVSIIRTGSYVAISTSQDYPGHTLVIDGSDGSIWAWCDNFHGQLGDGTRNSVGSPVSICRPGSYVAVAAGNSHSLALDETGMIWAWGYNDYGQLGNNASDLTFSYAADQSSPVSIARSASYCAIAAGINFSLAIDGSDGSVWAWGSNRRGQLGDNNSDYPNPSGAADRSSPVLIARPGSYIAIAASVSGGLNGHAIALLSSTPISNIQLRNCRVKSSYSDMVMAGDPFDYDSDTQFSFSFGGHTFPDADQVTLVNKNQFNYKTFGLTDETDPIIIQRWIDGGYNTGLFGEERKDAGAFYFAATTTTTTPAPILAKLYVVQTTNRHVVKLLRSDIIPATYVGKEFGLFGEPGSDQTTLRYPRGVAATDSNVFVCDTLNSRLMKLNSDLQFVDEYSTASTIGRPYQIMVDVVNGWLYIVGVFNGNYTRIQKLTLDLVNIYYSDNLHNIGGLIGRPTAICKGFDSDKLLVTGANVDIYETTESTGFSSFITRHVTGEAPKIYYGAIYHSNGYVYVNDGVRVLKVNSSYENQGDSNKISKTVRCLREDVQHNLLVYNADSKKILQYDPNLNFVAEIYTNTGSDIGTDAYDINDFVEI